MVRVQVADTKRTPVQRTLIVNSSCGLCGRAGIEELVKGLEPLKNEIEVPIHVLYTVPEAVLAKQVLFRETGGSHAAALFDPAGAIHVVREDLGRHNAVDKVVGHALLHGIAMPDMAIFLSGRASLEMIVRAARARIALVAAVSAASAMAVELAAQLGITLCGFVRGDEVVAYTHPRRIRSEG